MLSLKRFFPITLVLFIALFVAACGSSAGSSPARSSSTPAAITASSPTPRPIASPTAKPNPSATPASSHALIQTATAVVDGKSESILTNAQGMTLYYFTPDTPSTSACTGSCAGVWPPLIVAGAGGPTSSPALPGKVSAQMTANGNQVEYNGHLLYVYSGDSAPGQTNGDGLFGKWFVAIPNLA